MISDQFTGLFVGAIPGTHGVNGYLAALGFCNRLFEGDTAGIVFAIANDHEHPSHRLGLPAIYQLVGSKGKRVPQGRSTPRRELTDSAICKCLVCSEILDKKDRI